MDPETLVSNPRSFIPRILRVWETMEVGMGKARREGESKEETGPAVAYSRR